MKMKIFYVLGALALLAACRKGGGGSGETLALLPNTYSPGEGSVGSSTGSTALVNDQRFIDLVTYAVENVAAGTYLRSRLGNASSAFFERVQGCSGNSTCINSVLTGFSLNGDLLDDYFFSAMASALLFQDARPEFEQMTESQRNILFGSAIREGLQSSDVRWQKIKLTLNSQLTYFQNDLYKADPGWNQIVGCVIAEVGGIITSVAGLLDIKAYIKSGKIAKAVSTLKSFLKTGLGRTLSWVGLAITAWNIADCIYDLYYPENSTVWVPLKYPVNSPLKTAV